MRCPCCNSALSDERPAMVDLDSNTISAGNATIKLTPTEAEIAFVLLSRSPLPVRYEDAFRASSSLKGSDDPRGLMCVHVFAIRRKIRSLPLVIETVPSRGYRLRAKVIAITDAGSYQQSHPG